MYYTPKNAVELIESILIPARSVYKSCMDASVASWELVRMGDDFLMEFRKFLAAWFDVPVEDFQFSLDRATDPEMKRKPISSVTFIDLRYSSESRRVDVPLYFGRVLHWAALFEANHIHTVAYDEMHALYGSLRELRSDMVRLYHTPHGVLEVEEDYSGFYLDGKQIHPNPAQKKLFKMIAESGAAGLSPDVALSEAKKTSDKVSSVFRATEPGKALWKFIGHVEEKNKRSNWTVAWPFKKRGEITYPFEK